MNVLSATVHYMDLPNGEKVKYYRVLRKEGGTLIGTSALPHRFSPEIRTIAEGCFFNLVQKLKALSKGLTFLAFRMFLVKLIDWLIDLIRN